MAEGRTDPKCDCYERMDTAGCPECWPRRVVPADDQLPAEGARWLLEAVWDGEGPTTGSIQNPTEIETWRHLRRIAGREDCATCEGSGEEVDGVECHVCSGTGRTR